MAKLPTGGALSPARLAAAFLLLGATAGAAQEREGEVGARNGLPCHSMCRAWTGRAEPTEAGASGSAERSDMKQPSGRDKARADRLPASRAAAAGSARPPREPSPPQRSGTLNGRAGAVATVVPESSRSTAPPAAANGGAAPPAAESGPAMTSPEAGDARGGVAQRFEGERFLSPEPARVPVQALVGPEIASLADLEGRPVAAVAAAGPAGTSAGELFASSRLGVQPLVVEAPSGAQAVARLRAGAVDAVLVADGDLRQLAEVSLDGLRFLPVPLAATE